MMINHNVDWSSYELPGDCESCYRCDDYRRLPELLGAETLVWVNERAYQGSSFALLAHDGEYGYVTFSWGSCSGCDAMQAAEGDLDATVEVFLSLLRGTKWFPSLDAAKVYIAGIGGELHEWHLDEFKEFQTKVAALGPEAAATLDAAITSARENPAGVDLGGFAEYAEDEQ